MPIKVLFVNEYSVKSTLETMAKEGDNSAHLWGFDYLAGKEETRFAKNSLRLLSWQKKMHLDAILGGLYEEMDLLSQRKWADVIVAANINLVWGLGHLRGLLKLPPIVAVLHSLPAGQGAFYKVFMRDHLRGIDRVLCIAKKDHDYLIDTLGLDPRRVSHVPWSVEPKDFDRALEAVSAWKSDHRKYIISIGKTQRDYATLIRAFREAHVPELLLKIYSAGHGLTETVDHSSVVIHKDFVPFNECVKQYRDSLFVVIPMIDSKRTLGLTSMYDAMAVGKAFIMTKNPGIDIDIEKEKIGLWAEPGNAADLKDKMLYFLDHPDIALQYGANGRKYLQEKYNYKHFCAKLHEVVREVCASWTN